MLVNSFVPSTLEVGKISLCGQSPWLATSCLFLWPAQMSLHHPYISSCETTWGEFFFCNTTPLRSMYESEKWKWKSLNYVWLFETLWTLACQVPLWNSPGQNTGVGSLSFLQGIFPTQGSNPDLPHCRQILYHLSRQGSINKFVNTLSCFILAGSYSKSSKY